MVYYYESKHEGLPPVVLYMGKDKEENELLIRYGLDCDVWFHAENLSSAHVYARVPEEYEWDSIPEPVLIDAAQLTKANSIQGNKKDNIKIIYTPWSNLSKNGSMAVGQVGFEKSASKYVKKIHVKTRDNATINRLEKTKKALYNDLEQEKIDYAKAVRAKNTEEHRVRQKDELEKSRQYKKLAEQKNQGYTDLFDDESLRHSSNQFRGDDWEDDFM